ncbi:MAG: type I-B CRISPR-associated protein Cas8b/Csh1 [Actinomycetota bacterium]
MIESIYQIGRAVLERGGGRRMVLESLADNPPTDKDGKSYIAVLKLDTSRWKLDVDLRELGRESKTAARYLWLGNAPGANDDQDRLTTNNLSYIVSQTIPNLLIDGRINLGTPLYKKLQGLKADLYLDLGAPGDLGIKGGGPYRRNRYFWDLQKLGIDGPSLEELREEMKGGVRPKSIPQKIARALQSHFKHEIPDRGVLFTLELDGELLVDDEAYQEYLERRLIESVFEEAQEGYCHLSGEWGMVTTNMTRFKFKYYITDKLGFAARATKRGFGSNFALSRESYKALLVGERFVRRELGFYFAGARGYLIPDLYTVDVPEELPDALVRALRSIRSRTLFDIGRVQVDDLDEDLEDFRRKYLASGYMINLLFYRQKQAKFEVLQLIQDIPSYRLEELRQQGGEAGRLREELYGSEARELTLQQIYYLIPVRQSGDDPLTKEILSFYHTLISGGLIERKVLTAGFLELVRAYRFGNTNSYQISAPGEGQEDRSVVNYLAQTNLLLAFLRQLNQLKEEEVSQEYLGGLSLDDEEKEYLKRLSYDDQQAALYLLGVLIAEIANAQWRLGSDGRGGEKTILNKVNYQGMTLPRVQRLATELFDKLRQYRYTDRTGERKPLLQGRNESIFAQAQELLTEHRHNWRLTPAENVYYLLSGYSHRTFRAMTANKGQTVRA